MANSQYKRTNLKHGAPNTPSGWNVRGGAPLEKHWFVTTLKAQDSMAESAKRVVASRHMGGQVLDWTVPESDPDGAVSQDYPDKDDDREIGRYRFNLAPGCYMEARSLYIPSSPTHFYADPTWENEGHEGQTRWDLTWNLAANSDTSTVAIFQEGSQLQYGKQAQNINGVWPTIRHGYHQFVVPNAGWQGSAEAVQWSEWTRITAVQNDRGGTRTIHATLSEVPRLFVDTNTNSGEASAHAYHQSTIHPNNKPQTDDADGLTYEEHRFGTHRALDVARRQADRMGPIIFHWSAFFEGDGGTAGGNPGSVATASYPPTPYTNTATQTCLWDTSITTWSAAAPGFAIPGGYCKRFAENDPEQILPGGPEAVIPVRLNIYAKMSSGTGYVVCQSAARSKITKSITGSSFAWHTVTGFLECSRDGIDTAINGMFFGYTDGASGTLSVQDVCLQFGDYDEV